MNGFDLSTISSVYVGSTQHSSIYLGSTLIWPASSPSSQIPYITNGLIFYLDGIDKGTGGDWVDLVGNKNFTIYGTGITSQTDSYYFDRSNPSYLKWEGAPFNEQEYTVEVCIYPTENTYYVFAGGQRNSHHPLFYYNGGLTWGQDSPVYKSAGLSGGSKYTVSVNDDRIMKNGVVSTGTSGTDFWDIVSEQRIQIGKGSTGGAANNPYGGYIYSIRIYNRKLSQAEQLQNQIIDDQRFNLGLNLGYIENPNVEI